MSGHSPIGDHPRHALILELIRDYLDETGRSARWFGIVTGNDPRQVYGLKRGQRYPAATMLAICNRLLTHYQQSAHRPAQPTRQA